MLFLKGLFQLIFFTVVLSQICCGYAKCSNSSNALRDCINGECIDGECKCDQGWAGEFCNECGGRLMLHEDSGYITDGVDDYPKARECSWLIHPESKTNATIRLRLLEFATECGWDYLYIYDGNSAAAPLLATFNGLITRNDEGTNSSGKYLPEVVATSGSVFVHFFSDVEYVMKGFNISYSIDSCPQNCSTHGYCDGSNADVECECDSGWTGSGCEFKSCPENCSVDRGQGFCRNVTVQNNGNMCSCGNDYQGLDCGSMTPAQKGEWTGSRGADVQFNTGRSSHTVVMVRDTMWLYGGIQFDDLASENGFDTYNFTSSQWNRVDSVSRNFPSSRYGHSMVLYNGKVLVFGGREVTTSLAFDELWEFDIDGKSWTNILYTKNFTLPSNASASPLALWGHTGTLVELENGKNVLLVMFGFHTLYEYSGFVFEYDLDLKMWSRVLTNGAKIHAAFEHTTTWDPVNRLCYVHGGITYREVSSYRMTDSLHSYNPDLRTFTVLRPSGVPRYLHSGILSHGILFTYGGCTHNDSDKSTGALCFSRSFMAYHVACDTWEHLSPLDERYDPNRYGHVAMLLNGEGGSTPIIAIHGGYDGRILPTTMMYQIASCQAFSDNETHCIGNHHTGLSCMWNGTSCVAATSFGAFKSGKVSCDTFANNSPSYCEKLKSCASCNHAAVNCDWCENQCRDDCSSASSCEDDTSHYCARFRTCGQCEIIAECEWTRVGCVKRTSNDSAECQSSCGTRNTCDTCVSGTCMWCANKALCVSTTSYIAQFPYGECMKWINKKDQCAATDNCEDHRTCDACLADPFCGWCDDGSKTGLGLCHLGSLSGSQTSNISHNVISYNRIAEYNSTVPVCPADSWFFTSCPLCQCNGHSECLNVTSECIACKDHTEGEQCERCVDEYFGVATNGGKCKPCQCFDRAKSCHHTTGACYCSTKGMSGEKCDKCDNDAKYFGDPTKNSTCFYRLLINYSFTFTLTPATDEHITAINFENTPPQENNAELSFESRERCDVRLAVYSRSLISEPEFNSSETEYEYVEEEVHVVMVNNVEKFSFDFSGGKYGFGDPRTNATIRIYVSNFTLPTWIQVSIVQRNSFLLMLLLILFSVFLVLLLLTALAWKLKMLYDACQQRRQHAEQLEQMAARPFATVYLCLDDVHSNKPLHQVLSAGATINALAEEASLSGQAAAVSVALWMPTREVMEPGALPTKTNENLDMMEVSGALAIGTALVSRKPSSHDAAGNELAANSKSRNKKLKIVFKRGNRPTGTTSRNTNSTNQPRTERNTTPNAGTTDNSNGTNTMNCRAETTVSGQQSRPRSKRGRSSFSSRRSRSVSPGNDTDNERRSQRRPRETPAIPAFAAQAQRTNSRSEGIAI